MNLRAPLAASFLLSVCALAACSEDDDPDGVGGSGGSGASSSSSSSSASSSSSSSSASSTGVGAAGGGGAGVGGGGAGVGGGGAGVGGGGAGVGGGGAGVGGDGGVGGTGGTGGTAVGGSGGDGGSGGAPGCAPAGAQCAGGACTAAGVCAPKFTVVRVGDGSAMPTNASTAVFLEERALDGTLVIKGTPNPLPMPIAASGANQPLTVSGTATSEGNLSLSANGDYLLLAGYATAPGLPMVVDTDAATVQRAIARIDAAGTIDTTTTFSTAFSGNNVRAATSSDGTTLWASGNGGGGTGGVWTITFGTTGGTQLFGMPANMRVVHIFGGQLYVSSGSGMNTNVMTVGTGLPTTAGQTVTPLPGLPTTMANPHSYTFFDLNNAVAGVDALYIADDSSLANGGGIQKWTFDGTTWTKVDTFANGLTGGVRGLAGMLIGGSPVLLTVNGTNPPSVLVVTDDGSADPVLTPVTTAAAMSFYRGVAFSPN